MVGKVNYCVSKLVIMVGLNFLHTLPQRCLTSIDASKHFTRWQKTLGHPGPGPQKFLVILRTLLNNQVIFNRASRIDNDLQKFTICTSISSALSCTRIQLRKQWQQRVNLDALRIPDYISSVLARR